VREGNTRKETKYLFNEKEKREEEEERGDKGKKEKSCIPLALVQHLGVRESRTTKRVMRVNCDLRAQELIVRGSDNQESTTANGWYSLDRMGGRVVMKRLHEIWTIKNTSKWGVFRRTQVR
jgi:hypothetical protein